MFPIFALFFLLTIAFSGITTIPFSVVLIIVGTVFFKKSWIFFVAFGLGLFLDLILIRSLGYTGLVLTIFVFFVFLYERKFETRTSTFVFFATLLSSLAYLGIFKYDNVLLQSFVSAIIGTALFRLIQNSKGKSQKFK